MYLSYIQLFVFLYISDYHLPFLYLLSISIQITIYLSLLLTDVSSDNIELSNPIHVSADELSNK